MTDPVTIAISSAPTTVGGDTVVTAPRSLSGWEDVEVTLRAEGFPPSFRMSASSGLPSGHDAAFARAGDACSVRLGADLVITGYLTRLTAQAGPGSHNIELAGAGKTQDLVSEIDWNESSPYIKPTTDAVQTIAAYLNIDVQVTAGAATLPAGIPADVADYPILLNYGTPAAEYINQIVRILGLLAYEAADGSLVLSRAGTATAASGVAYGENVESFSIVDSVEDRFSEVIATRFPQPQFFAGDGSPSIEFYTARDPGMPRRRLRHVFVENGPNNEQFAQRMADWEVARRAARGRQIRATVDSWRDSAGALWTPNTIIPIDLPGVARAAGPFGLSEVTFRQNDRTGTTADLTLIPIAGFTPEPVQPTSANLVGVTGGTAD